MNIIKQNFNWLNVDILDQFSDAIYFKDLESKFILGNKKILKYFGLENNNQLKGKSDFDFFSQEHAKKAYKDEQDIIKTKKGLIDIVEKETWPDGTITWVSSSKMPLYDNNKIIGTFGASKDITLLVKQREKLEQLNKELQEINNSRDKFFSIITDDLRNPFGTLVGYCETLLNDFDNFDESQKLKFIEYIHQSSRFIYRTLENLFQRTAFKTGKIKYLPKKFNIVHLFDEIINIYKVKTDIKHITFVNYIKENIVYGDPEMIMTIIKNLVSNSIKFTPKYGKITFETNRTNGHLIVKIKDNGIGIKKEALEKLFDIFSIEYDSGHTQQKGIGLGLLLCKELVKKNGGEIRAESEGTNKGSCFCFTIPIAKKNNNLLN